MTPLPIDLPLSEVHLWSCSLSALDAAARERCAALLDDRETERLNRYLSAEAADQFLVGRALLRRCLSRYVPIAPADWRFETNAHGKPRIADVLGLDWLSFNVSNTRGMVACGVGRECALGVDVESDDNRYPQQVATRFFTTSEVAAIESASPAMRAGRFFRTWTLKEAIVKATGLGLSCPLSAFELQIDANPPQVAFAERMPEDARQWQLFSTQLDSTFVAAVAVRRPEARPVELRVERFPLDR